MPKRPVAKLHASEENHQGQERDWIRCQATWKESLQDQGDEETPEGEVGRD